jgi:hypothetical protein
LAQPARVTRIKITHGGTNPRSNVHSRAWIFIAGLVPAMTLALNSTSVGKSWGYVAAQTQVRLCAFSAWNDVVHLGLLVAGGSVCRCACPVRQRAQSTRGSVGHRVQVEQR